MSIITFIQFYTGEPNYYNKSSKINKINIRNQEEKAKIGLIHGNMIKYIGNKKESIGKTIGIIKQIQQVAGYEIKNVKKNFYIPIINI